MNETAEYIISKIPNTFIKNIDIKQKILILEDKMCDGFIWDTKIKYWIFNIEKKGYKVEFK